MCLVHQIGLTLNTFVHGFCALVPNYVAYHVVFWSNFCRKSCCFGDTLRPLKKLIMTQKVFFAGLSNHSSVFVNPTMFTWQKIVNALE